jgi:molybdopterin adenylyltransferase
MKPHEGHRRAAPATVTAELVTVSSSRYEAMVGGQEYTDEGGDVAESTSKDAGLIVSKRTLISDDADMLKASVETFLSGEGDVLLLTGGTGLSPRDITIETVRPYFEKELVGFGELLRRRSYEEVGAASTLTRATAGVTRGKLIVCMPGSPGAVRTALEAFAEEIPHVLFVARS